MTKSHISNSVSISLVDFKLVPHILNPQVMSSARTQSQLCTATPISSFVQCPISIPLLPWSVATFILIEIFLR